MKFQRALSFILTLTLSVSGICVTAPAIGAHAATVQDQSAEEPDDGEADPNIGVESSEPAEEDSGKNAAPVTYDDAADNAADETTEESAASGETENTETVSASENTEDEETAPASDDTESEEAPSGDAEIGNDEPSEEAAPGTEISPAQDKADTEENTADAEEDTADAREDTADAREDTVDSEESTAAPTADHVIETETVIDDPCPPQDVSKAAALAAEEVLAESVSFAESGYTIEVGKTQSLSYSIYPAGASYSSIEFSSSDTSVASINQNGVLTAHKPGYTLIEIRVNLKNGDYRYGTCGISVPFIDLTKASITGIVNKTYSGKEQKQNFTITYNGRKLSEGYDYLLSYTNNISAGTATMTIEGIGDYTGTVTRTFTIAKAASRMKKLPSRLINTTGILKKRKKGVYDIIQGPFNMVGESVPTVKLVSISSKAKKYIKVSKDGLLTIKKGIKAGKYKVKVRITIPQSRNYKKSVINKTITVTIKNRMKKKYTSLNKLGVKGYSTSVDKAVNTAFEELLMITANSGKSFDKLTPLQKATNITQYIGSYYYYRTGSYDAESMLKKGYGTCFAYSDLTYLMAKKAGLKRSWLTVPGRNVDHGTGSYGSQHRSVVTQIGKKFYELDSNKIYVLLSNPFAASIIGLNPERISRSYARYLIGKSNKYTSITVK